MLFCTENNQHQWPKSELSNFAVIVQYTIQYLTSFLCDMVRLGGCLGQILKFYFTLLWLKSLRLKENNFNMTFQVKANGTLSSCCDIKYKQGQSTERGLRLHREVGSGKQTYNSCGKHTVSHGCSPAWPLCASLPLLHFSPVEESVVAGLFSKSLLFWEPGL